MWIVVTAIIDATTTRSMRMNFDNVVSYGPAKSAPCVVICVDQQAYPIKEAPERIDAVLAEATGRAVANPQLLPHAKRKK